MTYILINCAELLAPLPRQRSTLHRIVAAEEGCFPRVRTRESAYYYLRTDLRDTQRHIF